jgi:ABC-type oligopeptide transport system substrate-binding subunit
VSRRLGVLLLALVAGVALLVSAAFADPDAESRRGGTLRLMWGAEPELDPALAAGNLGSWMLLNATCAKLFTTVSVPKTGRTRVVPEVVRSYEVSGDGRTYTFELERTFRFDNRVPVTARSFADAFNRTASPTMNSAAWRRGFFQEITGADAFREGKSASISGVQVLGKYRLRIRLERRAGDFLARLTMPFFCPILPRTPISPAGIDDPPGSGPYHIADRVRERRMVLKRNPYYGGDRTANPDSIIWTIETDFAERIRATERNENDFTPVFGYPDAVVHELEDKYGINRPGGQFRRLPTLSNFMFAFNTRSPAFKGAGTAPLRKAINYALDRYALNRAHGYLTGRRTDRLLPAALSESRRFYPIGGPDPVTARRWLAEARPRPKTLTLYSASFTFGVPTAQVFKSNLRQLDIDVDVKLFSFPTLVEKLVTKGEPWDVVWLPWGAFYPGPAGYLFPLLNDTRYESRIDAANRVTGEARAKSWAKLEADLMRNDPPVAVYADSMALVLTSRSFGCFPWVPGADLDLGAVCVK